MKKINLKPEKRAYLQNILSKHNSYDDFCRCTKDAYEVAGELGVTVCTYCNEQYIFTIPKEEDKSPTRPEFDHFIGKNLNHSKALELENLVPSCHICNSNLKHNKEFKDETHLNPYKDDFDSILKFQAILNESWNLNYCDENSFEIKLVPHKIENKHDNKRAYNNARVFRIEDRYRFHKNEVIKILKMMKYYTASKQKELANILGTNDIYLFKNILFPDIDCDINNTSLGKLKRDIFHNFIG